MAASSPTAPAAVARPSTPQLTLVTLLRIAVGWHFLYEGLVKLWVPGWTSAPYLATAHGPLAGAFHWLASSPSALAVADVLNAWGLTLVGLGLMLGCFTRLAAFAGMLMLALYYAAHPSFFAPDAAPVEGHYLLVNKNLVELLALAVVAAVPTGRFLGLDRLLAALRRRGAPGPASARPSQPQEPAEDRAARAEPADKGRRAILAGLVGLPFLGALVLAFLKKHGWRSHEEEQLAAKLATPAEPQQPDAAQPAEPKVDGVTTATIKTFDFKSLKDLKGRVPHAKLGKLDLSRLILGGNLIGGWAHARDLIYVSSLVKAYHHKWKVFETFSLAEKCGINAFLTNPILCDIIQEYWKRDLGKIQFISDCGGSDLLAAVKKSIDAGAAACYVQGGTADGLVARKQFDPIAKALDLIRASGLPAGIGAHKLATVERCVEQGLKPDFWMKTLHHHRYWSAFGGKDECDNLWCDRVDEAIAFMRERPEPWIAFKTLAAGAIRPQDGFRFALKNGADFICVGMYDFQLVEDTNLALEVLAENQQRDRPWRA